METNLPLVALVGRPNVGKSSLFNRLLGKPAAITAREPGTTRDSVARVWQFGGRSANLVDTGGLIHKEPAATRSLGQAVSAQSLETIAAADLVLLVVDGSIPPTSEDRTLAKTVLKQHKPVLLVINKSDRKSSAQASYDRLGIKEAVLTSATTGQGTATLIERVGELLPIVATVPAPPTLTLSLVGRPNVGKSSLFNALLGKSRAIVSSSPHTTRDANHATLKLAGSNYRLIDTGGIRKPGRREVIEKFSYARALTAVEDSDVAILVMDASEPSVAQDQKLAGVIKDAGRGLVIAVNKWDLIADKATGRLNLERRLKTDFAFAWWAPLVLVSAKRGRNLDKLLELAGAAAAARNRQFETARLEQILVEAIANYRPPNPAGKGRPELKSLTQTGESPPEFTFTGTNLDNLHWSYKRYLESQLREHLGLTGTPIRLAFKTRQDSQKNR